MAEPISLGTTLAITAAMAAAQGGLAIAQAQQRNNALRQNAENQRRAASIQRQQASQQASFEQQKRIAEFQRTSAMIRVAQGDSGVGTGGSYSQVEANAAYASAADRSIIGQNNRLNLGSIDSRLNATLSEINNNMANPFMSGFSGLLSGASTGLGISSSINSAALRSPGPDATNLPGLADMSPDELARVGL